MKGVEMRSATKCRNKVEAGIPPPRNCPSTRDLVSSFPPLSLPGSVVLEARPDSFSLIIKRRGFSSGSFQKYPQTPVFGREQRTII